MPTGTKTTTVEKIIIKKLTYEIFGSEREIERICIHIDIEF